MLETVSSHLKAVDRWATRESERQGVTLDEKRRILGEEIVKAIRFPLMSEKEFVSIAFDSHVLTFKEVGDMMKHYNGVSTSLPFLQAPRSGFAAHLGYRRCCRFRKFLPPKEFDGPWDYSGRPDSINFTVDKPIKLYGVQHFGSEGVAYTVATEVKDTTDGSSLVKQHGVYASVKDETESYYGFDVQFVRPVVLKESKVYKLMSLIRGPRSWYGQEGQKFVDSQGIQFTFSTSGENAVTNATSDTRGQFPALFIG